MPNARTWGVLLAASLTAAICGAAEAPPVTFPASLTAPSPEQDDAALRDVAFTGAAAWAVGDRGAIWKSTDQGAAWNFCAPDAPFGACSFHSVCFLTDRVGWIVGGRVPPIGGEPQGLLLATRDGGQTWTLPAQQPLPYLKHVQFFDLDNGVAVGERSLAFPGGALRTQDGGRTWTPFPAERTASWNAAAFFSPAEGVLAGERGTQALVGKGAIVPGGFLAQGLPGFRAAAVDGSGRAWLAGEGARLLRSENRGATWTPAGGLLSQQLENVVDFSALAVRGAHVWAAGTPGAVIWHSPDGGGRWEAQSTGDPLPLRGMRFANDLLGAAVGDLGRICITQDGGQTWRPVRGGNRRLACLAVQTQTRRAALPFLTRWSKEDGYRAAALLATRRDIGPDAHAAAGFPLRFQHAVLTAGGSAGEVDWRLPIASPELELNRNRLLEEWTLLTDRRLAEVVLESLVGRIRTWRPALILIDEPASGDAAAEVIQQAVSRAIELAADDAYASDVMRRAGLPPWSVSKLVLQRSDGQIGTAVLEPFEMLPHLGTTLDIAASPATGMLQRGTELASRRFDFALAPLPGRPLGSDRTLFADLGLAPGSDARRLLGTLRDDQLERLAADVQHRRTATAICTRVTAAPETADQLLGQLSRMVAPLSPGQAARQLADLGRLAGERGEWVLAEGTYAELIIRYPAEPPAVEAMLWLLKFWTSAELNWQRLQSVQATSDRLRIDGAGVTQGKLEQAISAAQQQATRTGAALLTPTVGAELRTETSPLVPVSGALSSVVSADGTAAGQHQMLLTRWHALAGAVAAGLETTQPQLLSDPQTQFVLAALARRRGDPKRVDAIYANYLQSLSDDPWNVAARGEAYLLRPGAQSPKPIAVCKQTPVPPVLDGVLSDPCWAAAGELRLGTASRADSYVGPNRAQREKGESAGTPAIVMCAHDDRYLYIAASVPIDPRLPGDAPLRSGRRHDADLRTFDRLSLQFDVDRDYAVFYQFDIDQRGCTREACWDNPGYNPAWHCAAERSLDAWRIECAIPLEAFLPPGRVVGTTWAVGVTRVMPGIGVQSWSGSGGEVPEPPRFGLLRFE